MPNPLKSANSSDLGLLAARLPLGVLFAYEGYNKLAHIGITKFVIHHLGEVPSYMPANFGKYFLASLPYAELALGLCIVAGFLTRVSGFFTSCLLISYLMITGVHDRSSITPPWPFHPSILCLGVALLLLFTGGGGISVEQKLLKRGGGGGFKSVPVR